MRFAVPSLMSLLSPAVLCVPPHASPGGVPAEPASLGGTVTSLPSADKPQGPARLCPAPRLAPEEWDCREVGQLDFRGLVPPERCRLPIYIPDAPQPTVLTWLSQVTLWIPVCMQQQAEGTKPSPSIWTCSYRCLAIATEAISLQSPGLPQLLPHHVASTASVPGCPPWVQKDSLALGGSASTHALQRDNLQLSAQ